MEGDWWLLLAELPGEDIGLYCGKYDEETVYLRYGETFQVFQQDLSGGGHLPEMERVDDSTIAVQYYQEGGSRWTRQYHGRCCISPPVPFPHRRPNPQNTAQAPAFGAL